MPAPNVDIVFVLDASGSMRPCFEQLSNHLKQVLQPMQGFVSKVRFGLVTMNVGSSGTGHVYCVHGVGGVNVLDALYDAQGPAAGAALFTEDPAVLSQTLANTAVQGDEDMLLALDSAADFPFGPVATTKRVIAMFSDEPFETGLRIADRRNKLPALMQKLMDRHIQLFCALPDGETVQELSAVDRSEIELVSTGDGLAGVDIAKLLLQMGKSVSASSLQLTAEPAFQRAIYGQDTWGRGEASSWAEGQA